MDRILHDVGFVHLHVHSSYSLLEGALTIAGLAKLASADGQPALALTDTNNLFGALEFSEKLASAGVHPIAGVQLGIRFGEAEQPGRLAAGRSLPGIVLLAQNDEGYANLMRLVTAAYFDIHSDMSPQVPLERLHDFSEGIIALTGGPGGPVDFSLQQKREDAAARRLELLRDIFMDRLYVELQRHGDRDDEQFEPELVRLAYDLGLPMVATNEPYFATREDYQAQDALLAIADGRIIADESRRRLSQEHWFKPRAEMVKLFADIPEACSNTVEIAMRCSARVRKRNPILPRFAEENSDEAQLLREQAKEGLRVRIATQGMTDGLTEKDYEERLDYELSVIERMQYPGYFLIVADFIRWAKSQDIPVGPGRGSGAGSLVAYALAITDLDPIRFGLLFERFLNPERVSMPDFDIDFCQDRREEVIRYVQERYGDDKVAQIITFGTLQARGVMRDVGRVLELPYGQVDKLTKLVPQNPANPVTLAAAIEGEPKLRAAGEEEPVVGQMLAIARKLEGLHRHASTHAAGIVIGDRSLDELVPLYRDPRSGMRVTQYNMKWVEQAGLVKFDFLGLKTLTVLSRTTELLRRRNIEIDLLTLPLGDPVTYEMLGRGDTVGVFQVESPGMRKALVEMRADRFEDLIALVALYRPGPMANIPTYCARKQGLEQPTYLSEKLKPILEETHGIIVYQEQVMQVAQILSGYSLGDADLLRRAMGKKIKSEMDAQRDRFVVGATERGLTDASANEIFDLLAKFADYGFNKSHAAAYALVAYQTAYLKANYPVEFLAASMTLEMDNTDKLSDFRRDAQRLGIRVAPPSVAYSGSAFDVHDGEIRYALSAVKGVGTQTVDMIVATRTSAPFRDLSDFARRLDPKAINKRALESLIAAGALDCLEPDRARACAAIDAMMAMAQQARSREAGDQNELFAGEPPEPLRLPACQPWQPSERLQKEYDAVGFFLSGHPLDEYDAVLDRLRVQRWSDFARSVRSGASVGRLAATVLDRAERRTRTGSKMGIVTLSDQTGHFEAIIFSEGLQQYRDLLEPGRAVLLGIQASSEGEEIRARIQSVEPLERAAARKQFGLRIFLRDEAPIPVIAERLGNRGDGEVALVVMLEDGAREVEIRLPGGFQVSPQLAGSVRALPGVVHVELN